MIPLCAIVGLYDNGPADDQYISCISMTVLHIILCNVMITTNAQVLYHVMLHGNIPWGLNFVAI